MLEHLYASCRKIKGRDFRKSLGVFNYKVKGLKTVHKKPGVIPVDVKQKLMKEGTHAAIMKIKQMEGESSQPFGKWDKYCWLTSELHL